MKQPAVFSLEDVLSNTVLMHWKEVGAGPRALLHIEYHRQPVAPGIEYFRVWSSTTRGEWDLVCQYFLAGSPEGTPAGFSFCPPFYSTNLQHMFTTIMENQQCFADHASLLRDGMIQLTAPDAIGAAAAATVMQQAFDTCRLLSPDEQNPLGQE